MKFNFNRWYFKLATTLVLVTGLGLVAFFTLPWPGHTSVLMYHFVRDLPKLKDINLFIRPETLERQILFLKKFGYKIISLDEVAEIKSGKRKPAFRTVALTFDDGNVNFYEVVLPLLKKHNLAAAVFVVPKSAQYNLEASMSLGQIKEVYQQGITVGSHSFSHVILTDISTEEKKHEIYDSKIFLEELLGSPVNFFAYPGGWFDQEVLNFVKEARYKLGFTTTPKRLSYQQGSNYSIPRIKLTENSNNLFYFWLKVSGLYDFINGIKFELQKLFTV